MSTDLSCAELIMSISRIWTETAEKRMAELGLSRSDMELLSLVEQGGAEGLTLRQVEYLGGMSQPTASRLVSALHKRELIRYVPDKRDLRSKHAVLTDEGQRLCREVQNAIERRCEAAMSGLTEGARDTLRVLLSEVARKSKDMQA